jgi:hypothetical protein
MQDTTINAETIEVNNLILSTIYTRLDPWADVVAYGAVGNGVHDDTTAIQSAITTTQNSGGGTVFLPVGTYIINSALIITADNIQLVGAGWGTVLKPGSSFPPSTPMIWSQAPTDTTKYRYGIRISDIFLDGNNKTGVIGIQLDTTYFAELKHFRLERCIGTGVYLNSPIGSNFGAYNQISDFAISDGGAGTGILTNRSEHCQVYSGLIAWHNSAGGIGIKCQNSGCHFSHVEFDECDTGLDLHFSHNDYIIGCDFDRGVTRFIYLHGAQQDIVIGCQFGAFVGTGSKNMIDVDSTTQSNIVSNCVVLPGTGWTNFVSETGASSPATQYIGNDAGDLPIVRQTGIFRNNRGYNPIGSITPPSVPSTGVAYTNNFGVDCTVFVQANGATISSISIGGTATGATSGMFRVPAGQTITLAYTVATPTWTWFGD